MVVVGGGRGDGDGGGDGNNDDLIVFRLRMYSKHFSTHPFRPLSVELINAFTRQHIYWQNQAKGSNNAFVGL